MVLHARPMSPSRQPRSPERDAAIDLEAAKLPKVSPIVQDAILDMLKEQQSVYRPPEVTAALLALIVELHKVGKPFPGREVVARALGCSIYTIDSAISTRSATGYISLNIQTREGAVQRRLSVVKDRYYVPSQELIDVANVAHKREERARKRMRAARE